MVQLDRRLGGYRPAAPDPEVRDAGGGGGKAGVKAAAMRSLRQRRRGRWPRQRQQRHGAPALGAAGSPQVGRGLVMRPHCGPEVGQVAGLAVGRWACHRADYRIGRSRAAPVSCTADQRPVRHANAPPLRPPTLRGQRRKHEQLRSRRPGPAPGPGDAPQGPGHQEQVEMRTAMNSATNDRTATSRGHRPSQASASQRSRSSGEPGGSR